MISGSNKAIRQWTSRQALLLMTLSLLTGMAGGYVLRGDQPFGARTAAPAKAGSGSMAAQSSAQPGPTELKNAADQQAAPLIVKLNGDPSNADLLTNVGNLYYDAQQYATAVDYYARVLKVRPSDASVRTDMATAYWYMGNADVAIAEFNKALTYAPTNPNTLFNLGLVKWRGKHDGAGAIADWKKLLAANPKYEAREKVEEMLAEVQKQAPARSGT